jgi:DMSO reductase anchor subunit
MHPPFSVIFLTTLIGAGQGLFLALFVLEAAALFGLMPGVPVAFLAIGSGVAFVLLVGGLGASFLHLGRPERAWRAAAQWRTSWLSREVIALPAFMAALAAYGLAHASGVNPSLATLASGAAVPLTALLGLAGVVLAFALFVCTGMIYASLRFLREWHSPLTVLNFILLGSASGFTLAAALAGAMHPERSAFLAAVAVVLTVAALAGRSATLVRNARLKPKSTLQTALGIKHPRIVQMTQGAIGGSFNTREFFHGRAAGFLRQVRWLFLAGAFVLPAALLAPAVLGHGGAALLALAFALQYAGLLAERWFFFAQANHPQNLYYQCVS